MCSVATASLCLTMAGGCLHSMPSHPISSPIFRPPHPILNSVTPLSRISLLILLPAPPSSLPRIRPRCPRPLPASLPPRPHYPDLAVVLRLGTTLHPLLLLISSCRSCSCSFLTQHLLSLDSSEPPPRAICRFHLPPLSSPLLICFRRLLLFMHKHHHHNQHPNRH